MECLGKMQSEGPTSSLLDYTKEWVQIVSREEEHNLELLRDITTLPIHFPHVYYAILVHILWSCVYRYKSCLSLGYTILLKSFHWN